MFWVAKASQGSALPSFFLWTLSKGKLESYSSMKCESKVESYLYELRVKSNLESYFCEPWLR